MWLWLSSVVMYELHTTLPRLELICCPNSFIEEICWLQLVHSRINCTTQAINVSWRGHSIWPKLSIIVIVRSLLDIFFAVADILSTWIYRRAMNTWTCLNTQILHNTLALLHPDDSGQIWWNMNCSFHWYVCSMLRDPNQATFSRQITYGLFLHSCLIWINFISTKTKLQLRSDACCYIVRDSRTSRWQSNCHVLPRPFKLDIQRDYFVSMDVVILDRRCPWLRYCAIVMTYELSWCFIFFIMYLNNKPLL